MKKLLFFLSISTLGFAQNIDLLNQANNVEKFSTSLLPEYQMIDKSVRGAKTTYIFVPKAISTTELEDCKIGNPCDKSITLTYQNNTFIDAKGNYDALFSIWKKEIQPTAKLNEDVLSYKNETQKQWYNLVYTSKIGILQNFSNRLQ